LLSPPACTSSFPALGDPRAPPSFPTRRSSDLAAQLAEITGPGAVVDDPHHHEEARFVEGVVEDVEDVPERGRTLRTPAVLPHQRSEEHTSELQSRENLVCRLLLEKKKKAQQPR